MLRDRFAKSMTWFFRFIADTFFAERYGHRAVVLETVAGVPGMVGGMLVHLKSLRRMQRGNGQKIQELLDEAVNERKHLMFFIEIAQPNWFERLMIIIAQMIFFVFFTVLYLIDDKTAHRMIHYFEVEAVKSYTSYLEQVQSGKVKDVPAPQLAIDYYNMLPDAKLSDLIKYVRQDEAKHAEVNWKYSK